MVRKTRLEVRQQWRDRLRRFASSKLSVVEFCRREKVSAPSFYQWRKKLAALSSDNPPAATPKFLPVEVAATSPTSLQVTFPNGATLTLPVHDHELVTRSIEAIALAPTRRGGA